MTTPTPEAIEAAARALYNSEWGTYANWELNKADDKAYWHLQATAALSAAYPLMEAQAKGEAWDEGAMYALESEGCTPAAIEYITRVNPYRAATIEGKDS